MTTWWVDLNRAKDLLAAERSPAGKAPLTLSAHPSFSWPGARHGSWLNQVGLLIGFDCSPSGVRSVLFPPDPLTRPAAPSALRKFCPPRLLEGVTSEGCRCTWAGCGARGGLEGRGARVGKEVRAQGNSQLDATSRRLRGAGFIPVPTPASQFPAPRAIWRSQQFSVQRG